MVKIRKATISDRELFRIAAEDYAECMNTHCEMIDVEYASGDFADFLMDKGVVLVAEIGTRKVGVVGAIVASSPFNPKTHILQELLWWTDPSQRQAGIGETLLASLEEQAYLLGIENITMALINTSPNVGTWLKSKGYNECELSYMKSGG